MKITVISWLDWTHKSSGGAEKYLKEVLFRLSQTHDITLFCSKGEDLPDMEVINGIKIIRCGLRKNYVPYINQALITYRYYREQLSDDVIIVNNASQLYPLFRSDDRIDIYHLFEGRSSLEGNLKDKVRFVFEWTAMRLPKGKQIAVSRNQQKKIERETPQSIDRIVNGGVDLEQFAGDVSKFERPTMLHLGRLGRQKGTDRAIKIHTKVQERMDVDVDFHICGTGEMDDLARDYAENSETTTYHGYVSEKTKVNLMQRSWLKVMPSRSEAFPLVVMEANAAGTPVIASKITGLSDSIENGINGFCSNEEGMVENCIEILENEDYREKLSRSSREYAQQYSWDKTANKIECMLQSQNSPSTSAQMDR